MRLSARAREDGQGGRPALAAHLTRRRFAVVLTGLSVLLGLSLWVGVGVGSVAVDVGAVLSGRADEVDRVILLHTRLPRVLLAAAVGAALGLAGAVLQGLLRNPLAEPHLIGISGGAALGAVVAVVGLGVARDAGAALVPLAAAVGALLSTGVIYRLALVHGRLQPYVLLLAGVIYNAFAGALILCVHALSEAHQAQGILFWLMGNLAAGGYGTVLLLLLYGGVAALVLLRQARHLNVLSLGDEAAAQLGIDVARLRRRTFLASALLVGAAVAVSGMIGFVGLIVPHLARLRLGPDHRLLLPAAALGGASFLVLADTVARTALGGVEIPVGVVTALCGGPFFVFLLQREGRKVFAA